MAFTEDFTAFTDTGDFAVAAVYTPNGGGAVTVNGMFDNGYQAVTDGEVVTSALMITFNCPVISVPNAGEGDTLTVEGTMYHIVDVQPDGTGWQTLELAEQ